MLRIIRLSRFKFDNGTIQHNVTLSVTGLFDQDEDIANERIRIMSVLVESLFPNTINIVSIASSACPTTINNPGLKSLNPVRRDQLFSVGDEIAIDQLKDVMLYCYTHALEIELDILDIKNQHVTVVLNRDIVANHYLYGTPETFTNEYLATIKKKLKDCTFDGSFRKTL